MAHASDDDGVIDGFVRNLDEALRWCRPRFSMYDLERSLRSPELAPSAELTGGEHADEVVADVIERRRRLLLTDDKKPDVGRCSFWGYQRPEDDVSHNLLAVFPEESLSDGTSPPPTGGFIDVDDVPAWDTWVFFDSEMLVALVPPELRTAVDAAIWGNAYECIGWLGFRDHPLVARLREAKLRGVRL